MTEQKRASSGTLNEGLPVRVFAHAFEEGLPFSAFMHAFEESFPVGAFSHAFEEAFPVRVFVDAVKEGMTCFFSPLAVGRHLVEKLDPRKELPPERAYFAFCVYSALVIGGVTLLHHGLAFQSFPKWPAGIPGVLRGVPVHGGSFYGPGCNICYDYARWDGPAF